MRRLLNVAVAVGMGWLSAAGWAEELRDPFLFGSRGEAPSSAVVLSGVLWDTVNPLAMMGAETLHIGDVIEEWRIVEIQQDGIVIERGDRREFLAPGAALPSE